MPSSALAGLRIAALESRLAGPMSSLIRKHGGEPVEAPALREVPIGENPQALDFARRLIAGEFDVVLFLTGVGARYLLQEIETTIAPETFFDALNRASVIVRGPKPLAVMREWNVKVDVQVPEPNTWKDILATVDRLQPIAGKRVAVQEYGKPNPDLVAGLEHRGATVTRVPVYRWALPVDTKPLENAIRQLAEGKIDAVLFTSAQQVVHLLEVAANLRLEDKVIAMLRTHVIVGSVGPTTSETLREHGLPVDIEPEHPKMGHLVNALAEGWRSIPKARLFDVSSLEPVTPSPSSSQPDPLQNSRFLRACRREPNDVTPVWLMRQAGRYMSEYRSVRAKVGFLELCKKPELACEVTVTAAEKLGVDAAILFADILLILEPLGFDLEFAKGEGPVIHNPIREAKDVDRVRPMPEPEPLGYVYEAVRQIRAALPSDLPLIGFAGAPFTLACYAIEGGSSRHYQTAKGFMYKDPGAWNTLMHHLVQATVVYLNAQADAGAQVLQLFDSWVGNLSPDDYSRFVQPHMKTLFASLRPGIPTIHFGTDTGSLLELQRDAGGDVIGVDWRVNLDDAWDRLGPEVAVQGNLDPVVLFAPIPEIRKQADGILKRVAGRAGHIFNLGHGILPTTPVDHVRALIDCVHAHSAKM